MFTKTTIVNYQILSNVAHRRIWGLRVQTHTPPK